jgi:Tfp pilus assembly protein PilN
VELCGVRRINYLVSWSERSIGVALPNEIAPALRIPLIALAAATTLVALLWTVQATRLRTAERDATAYAYRLAAADAAVARVRVLEREVAQLRSLSDRVAQIRRTGDARASEIAALGNRLPDGVWLSSLRADRGVLALEGRSARLSAVGTAMDALAGLPGYSGARLVAVRTEPARSGVTYSVELERRR